MRYWKWPVQGNGSHSYSWNGITLSVNFGSATYDWDNMLPNYTGEYTEDQANAVAQLMYHAGVACNMSYSSDASSAYTENMGNGMINYFRYKSNGYHTQWYTSLSLSEINTMFIEDLLAGRPILMGGAAADRQSGHEFVCDGIDADGLFHINWGWGGSSNGFFALSALDPDQQGIGGSASGSGYSNDIDFMIGLEPDGRAVVDVTGISVAPTTLNLDIKAHEQLSFTVTPANANNRAVTWSSQDENIAIVDATGNVTGLSAGTTTITATTLDGSHSASCIVTVSSTIASAIELTVNWGYAEYDAQYVGINMPWSYILRNINTNGQRPLVVFWPHYSGTNGIAGTYELYGQGGYMRLPDSSTRLNILSGQLVVTCIGKNNGDNGCNTYHFLAYFTCDDGQDYKVDATIEMCAEDPDGTAITLSDDNVGDGTAYEVTWMANGQVWEKNIAIENKLSLPAINPAGCGEKVFVGWSATELATETDVIPTFAKNGNVISANTTYYAVYATPEEGGAEDGSENEFAKINTAAELTNGNYLVVGVKNGYYAMKNAIKANYYIDQTEVSPVNDVITTTDASIIWQITVNNNALSFYNEAAGKYVYLYMSGTYKDAGLTESTSESIHFSYTVNNGVWDFINTGISGLHLEYYGQKSEFAAYTSAGDPIYLYKQTASGITYSAYSTVCVEEGTAVEQIRVAPTALKRLEDGKIVILLGNEKYTIFGQKIK